MLLAQRVPRQSQLDSGHRPRALALYQRVLVLCRQVRGQCPLLVVLQEVLL